MPRTNARVRLRSLEPSDEAELLGLIRSSRAPHRPWTYLADTPEGFRQPLARAAAPTEALYLICRADGGEIAGDANLRWRDHHRYAILAEEVAAAARRSRSARR